MAMPEVRTSIAADAAARPGLLEELAARRDREDLY
jgi:hypothetical protein